MIKENKAQIISEKNSTNKTLNLKDLIEKSVKVSTAYDLAKKVHSNQTRFSGEPYLTHLEAVTEIILNLIKPEEINKDIEDLVCAGLLHDSVEDTNLTLNDIENKLNSNVSELVGGVTVLRSDKPKEVQDRENLQFIAEKGYINPKVFVLKLADRLHNMRTLDAINDPEKRRKKADETLRVYTKLAQSMGMWEVKKELEDLSFQYVYPEIFEKVKESIDSDPRTSPAFRHGMEGMLKWVLSDNCINCDVEARVNSYWTLYNKMEKAASEGKSLSDSYSQINDVVSFRITTPNNDPIELYTLMGRIHNHPQFKSLIDQERFDDFVSQPRDNGYSALQTTLNIPYYGAVEIAFVTQEMEDFNRSGIINTIRQKENLDKFKRNIVFDEKGDAWFLSLDATYIDYVYMTGVGAQVHEVKINNENIPLTQMVQNAVQIQINRHKELKRAPDPNLLEHCSVNTKRIIENEINLHAHDILVEKGKCELERILTKRGLLDLTDSPETARMLVIRLGLRDLNELYYRIGGDYMNLEQIDNILNVSGATKDSLGFTTIRISGRNQPGIVSHLSTLIDKMSGDIYQIHLPNPIAQPEDTYNLRIVVKGLSNKNEAEIKKLLSENNKFDEVLVV